MHGRDAHATARIHGRDAHATSRTPGRDAHATRSAFTLIELLLVLVILAVLAAVVVPRLTGRVEDSKIKATKAEISNIQSALKHFEIDTGRFPTSDEGIGALMSRPGNVDGWKGSYLDNMPVDPWLHPYIYHCPGANNKDFDIISMGPDGQENTADDIHN